MDDLLHAKICKKTGRAYMSEDDISIRDLTHLIGMMVSRYSKPAYCIMSPFTRCDMDAFKKVLAAYGVELRMNPLCPLSHAYLVPELP